jgi:hypothetical protein
LKKEARIAFVDCINDNIVITIIFRGCWIDGICIKKGVKDYNDLISWLMKEGYYYEIRGFHLSENVVKIFGHQNHLPIIKTCKRNINSARVIIEGIKKWLKPIS